MPPGLPKYVKAQPDAKGVVRFYFRYRNVYQRLPDDPDSPEFYQRYSTLLATIRESRTVAAEDTMAAVIADYKGTEGFKRLAAKTQRTYNRYIDRFADYGHWPVADFKRRHIKELQKPLNKTPRAARYFASVCSVLFAHAVELDLIEVNPASGMKRVGKPKPYKAWGDGECGTFEASNPLRGLMTAYMLGRYTGQRLGDVLAWTRSIYNGPELRFRQSKTVRLERPEMVIPALPPLKAYLDALPLDTVLFVTTRNGRAYGEEHFHREFRAALDACGLRHLSFHGLRHAAGVSLAEGGGTEKEIMAWLGHSSPTMAAHYCKTADQKRLARSAAIKLIGTRTEQESGKSDA